MALLIAAHGERQPRAGNASTLRIARAIAARDLVAEVAVGFINGAPSVSEALGALAARRIFVYPLFAANGYFTRDRLVRIIDEASGHSRSIELLPPLGLDRGLPGLIADRARIIAAANGFSQEAFSVVLLAHGSRRNPASREATEWVAGEVAKLGACRQVKTAFLEERPSLEDVAKACTGPTVVVGMFSGEGLHGARDASRLIAELGRPDVAYAGVIGNAPGIEDVVARAVEEALSGTLATAGA
ncbi:CbiX/SirB N-terminal domain-containing protein [Bradyrhizobium sp.]|uniref:CbiX/SirB N-terminal domain-containing protein n=1 Tax=Bradyrhizobium sp. TaxID=376 RepID=UPI0040377B0A